MWYRRVILMLISLVAAALAFMVLSLAVEAEPMPVTIGPGANASALAAALKRAPSGAVIRVMGGHYTGHFVITKPLTLIGLNRPILDGGGSGTIVTIQAPRVQISGFRLEHSGSLLGASPSAISIESVRNVTVRNNVLADVEYGVYVAASHDCQIVNNQIAGKTNLSPEDRGDGIRLWNSNTISVHGNRISYTRDGMEFEFSSHDIVYQNNFTNLRYGLHYMYSDYNDFHDNYFSQDVAGAAPMYSGYLTFYRNVFAHMTDYRGYGVLLKTCHDSRIEDNLFIGNTVGLFMDESSHNVVRHNAVIQNGIGLWVSGSCYGNTIYANNMVDNVTQVGEFSAGLPNAWSLHGQGNYWSDYIGYDVSGRGIGAYPYHSANYFATVTSQFPVLLQFAGSPSITAIQSAENHFPLAQFSGITDVYPLTRPVSVLPEWGPYLQPRTANWRVTAAAASLCALIGLILLAKGAIRRNRRRHES